MSLQAQRMSQWFNGLYDFIMTEPAYEELRPLFPQDNTGSEPASSRDCHFNAFRVIFRNLSRPAEGAMIEAINSFIHQKLEVKDSGLCGGKFVERVTGELNQAGYSRLPVLSAKIMRDMRDYFENEPCYPGPYDAAKQHGNTSTFQALRERKENTARYPTKSVLMCPHLAKIANDPLIISSLERHLGTIPLILDYSCWWSFAHEDQDSQEAQLFHFDLGDYRFCLMFIYLTDVDMGGGPHTYVEGTHELNYVSDIRAEYEGDPEKWDDWYFSQLRKTDDEVEHYFNGRTPVSLTGPSGSSFLVNTRGIHKGLLPTTSDRLIIQIVFGVSPMLQTAFDKPVKKDSSDGDNLPNQIWTPPFDYVNSLFMMR